MATAGSTALEARCGGWLGDMGEAMKEGGIGVVKGGKEGREGRETERTRGKKSDERRGGRERRKSGKKVE